MIIQYKIMKKLLILAALTTVLTGCLTPQTKTEEANDTGMLLGTEELSFIDPIAVPFGSYTVGHVFDRKRNVHCWFSTYGGLHCIPDEQVTLREE